MCERIILNSIVILMRILVIDTVNHSRLEQYIRIYLCGSQCGGTVCREERAARTATEYHYSSLFKMPYSLLSYIRLGYLLHVNGSLHTDLTAKTFEYIGNSKCVHCCSKHTDMVGSYSVHILA